MENLGLLITGVAAAISPINLIACLAGVLLGTLIGVLPGIGPTAGIAIVLPLTYHLPDATAVIMLAGIWYGAMYGGSTTAILLNLPGEAASVVTALDGYMLAKAGRAGNALAVAAISSFIAGTLSLFGLVLIGPTLAHYALAFGPPEYFALIVFGLTIVVGLSGKSLVKGLLAAGLGALLATIGIEPTSGMARFAYTVNMLGGIDFVTVVVGLFAVGEILVNLDSFGKVEVYKKPIGRLLPSLKELAGLVGTFFRCTVSGFFIGCIPGGNPAVASFIGYDIERRFSKERDKFGKGAMAGVAAAEGANNSACSGGFVPLFTLGIPTAASLAVLLGAFMMRGLQPGPLLFQKHPEFVWAVIGSMYVGNVLLLILNLPLIGVWVRIISVPYQLLAPIVMVFCFIGAYAIRNSMFDVGVAIGFGAVGYVFRKLDIPTVPIIIAMILSPMMENSLRQTLSIARGDLLIFLSRPIALFFLALAFASVALSLFGRYKERGLWKIESKD